MADAQAGNFDRVAVWMLDRLGRSLQHLLRRISDLSRWGVGFASLCDSGIDTTTPTGRLMMQIPGALAEYEKELIPERALADVRQA
jgi:DNA invertase Pin-like site-specific DNA recombinase